MEFLDPAPFPVMLNDIGFVPTVVIDAKLKLQALLTSTFVVALPVTMTVDPPVLPVAEFDPVLLVTLI